MKPKTKIVVAVAGTLAAAAILILFLKGRSSPDSSDAQPPGAASTPPGTPVVIELSDSQLPAIQVGSAGRYAFPVEKEAVGSIDFDEDLSVQVFPPYQGKIVETYAKLGDAVERGKPLYTIESPDLLQAESALVGAAAALELTNKELARAKALYEAGKGVSQRELEQATSDQQTAESGLNTARSAVRVFGKTDEEIDKMIATRESDPILVVRCPVSGQVTARNAQPGLLVQPGNAPAPYSVADVSSKWMLAFVTETDSPLFEVGQPVDVAVMAFPGRKFSGKISAIGATVDPNTHRVSIRSEIADPTRELRPGMFATFTIRVHDAEESVAMPVNGVVREGDGTMTVWIASDRHHFVQRTVKVGLQRDGRRQILDGLKIGEPVVTDGAVFLSNMLTAPDDD
jgi:cobalt-zinc-cadmium efflux system membrane fusion protein